MIIDMNTYFGVFPFWELRNNGPEGLIGQMDKYGIDRAFVSSLRGVYQHDGAGNEETLEACGRHPDRLWPALTFNPHRFEPWTIREELGRADVRMVKLFFANHSYDPNEEPRIAELMQVCGELGVPVMIPNRLLTSQRFPAISLPNAGRLIAAHPGTKFIIASINYLFEYQSTLHILRTCPNAYVETSAMMGLEEIERFVGEVGAGRLLHGSCGILQMTGIGPLRIESAQISDEEKQQIFSGNAIELFGLHEKVGMVAPRA